MELCTYWENDGLSAAQQNSPPFMKPKCSPPCQNPVNRTLYGSK